MDNKAISKRWNKKWEEYGTQPTNIFAIESYNKYIKDMDTEISILDLGCGNGSDTTYFYNNGFKNITAVDFSRKALSDLNKKIDVNTLLGELETVEFKNNSMDVIYAHLSLHYFENGLTKELFKKCARWLKPNGLFFVKCKSLDDPIGQEKQSGGNMFKPHGEYQRHLFSKEYMKECLDFTNSGDIISIVETHHDYHGKSDRHFIEAVFRKNK